MLNLKRITTTAALAICLAAPGVAAARPAAGTGGTNFHAAGENGDAVALSFSRDGRRVKRAFLSYAMKCSDGVEFTRSISLDDIRVTPRGSFKVVIDTGPVANETGSETDRVQLSLSGRRTRSRVTGTSRLTIEHVVNATGARVTCHSGPMNYVAAD